MQNKFFGSKLKTFLLFFLIVLVAVCIWMLVKDREIYFSSLSQDKTPSNNSKQNNLVDTTSQKFAVVVWDSADVTGPEGSGPVYFEYYNIPSDCLKNITKQECDISYLRKYGILEKADVTGAYSRSWSVNGQTMTYDQYNNYFMEYAKTSPSYAGYVVGYASVKNGSLASFDWVRGTPYENVPWVK